VVAVAVVALGSAVATVGGDGSLHAATIPSAER
jgi:hypothetical protein